MAPSKQTKLDGRTSSSTKSSTKMTSSHTEKASQGLQTLKRKAADIMSQKKKKVPSESTSTSDEPGM